MRLSFNIEDLIEVLKSMDGLGVFIGVILEAVFAPIPSPLIPLAAGALLIPANASLTTVFCQSFTVVALWGAFGATLGALVPYAIAYYGGRLLVEKYGGYFGFSWDEVEKIQKKLEKMRYDEVIIFICRFVPVIPLSPISLLFGIVHFNIAKFLILTFIGAIPRYLTLAILGWYFKSAYMQLANLMGFYETIITILIICVVVLIFIAVRKRRKKRKLLNL